MQKRTSFGAGEEDKRHSEEFALDVFGRTSSDIGRDFYV